MSQGDYINYKRTALELQDAVSLDKMPRILDQTRYTAYKSFSLLNKKYKDNDTFYYFVDDSKVNIYGMWKDLTEIGCTLQPYSYCGSSVRSMVDLTNQSPIIDPPPKISVSAAIKLKKWGIST